MGPLKSKDLRYALSSRCQCGALLAYRPSDKKAGWQPREWDCSDILLGRAAEKGKPGSVQHSDVYPFIFWKIKEAPRGWVPEEDQ